MQLIHLICLASHFAIFAQAFGASHGRLRQHACTDSVCVIWPVTGHVFVHCLSLLLLMVDDGTAGNCPNLPSLFSFSHTLWQSPSSSSSNITKPLVVVRRYCIENHGVCDPLCLQTQLTDAQQRICDLEAEVARSKLELSMQSHNTPCPKCRSMEASFREVLSQVSVRESSFLRSKFPEGLRDYHNVRSSAFANLCAGSPSKVGCVFDVVLICGFFFPLLSLSAAGFSAG